MDAKLRIRLLQVIQRHRPVRLLVAGDIILDKYTWGEVERISPEAPIPVVKVVKEEYRLGGSASVVANLAALDCQVLPLGWVGQDAAGDQVLRLFQDLKVEVAGVLRLQRATTLKDRLLTKQQQLLRVDFEAPTAKDTGLQQALRDKAESLLRQADAVVLSDYAKGVLSPGLLSFLIQGAEAKQIPVICDPGKGVPLEHYQGVTTLKPNRMETEGATGMKIQDQASLLAAAKAVKEKTGAQFLSLSLDKEGILYYQDETHWEVLATEAREVYDVTGAGDMVVSVIACLLAQQVPPIEALALANVAAEIEIGHMGVVPIPFSEIRDFLVQGRLERKITTIEEILAEKGEGEQLLFTNGYFDQLSAGHLRFLIEAARLPGKLVVAINSDASIQARKGELPLLTQADRARLLASLEKVWKVLIFEEEDASPLIIKLRPEVVVKGERFRGRELSESQAIAQVGAKIEYIPHFSYS